MNKKLIIAAALASLLAACNGPATPSNGKGEGGDTSAAGHAGSPAARDETANQTVVVAGNVTESPAPLPTAKTPSTFPVAFRGRWGMNANDCDPKRDDNKGLLTVSAETLTFYESRAKITALTSISPTTVLADLSFSGEGQSWNSKTAFALADGGKTLLRTEEEPASSYRYQRC
jgi:hypothetical protein